MTDELRNFYRGKGALDRYFEGKTPPLILYRGRRSGEKTDLLQPVLIGWYGKDKKTNAEIPRRPDVLLNDGKGKSPQYKSNQLKEMVVETEEKLSTADILKHADKYVVKGCRTMSGHHRGVSVFDKTNPRLPAFEWFAIPPETALDDALAVTRDSKEATSSNPIHYTIAPKDDMTLSLFLTYLAALAAKTSKVAG